MFNSEKTVMCVMDGFEIAEPKFVTDDENAFDICIHVTSKDDPAESDWWRGECSDRYGKGGFSEMKQIEIAFKSLRSVGFVGSDLTKLEEQLNGKEAPVTIKRAKKEGENGKIFYNISYIGGSGEAPTQLDVGKKSLADRMKEMIGSDGKAQEEAPPAPPIPDPTDPIEDTDDLPF